MLGKCLQYGLFVIVNPRVNLSLGYAWKQHGLGSFLNTPLAVLERSLVSFSEWQVPYLGSIEKPLYGALIGQLIKR